MAFRNEEEDIVTVISKRISVILSAVELTYATGCLNRLG